MAMMAPRSSSVALRKVTEFTKCHPGIARQHDIRDPESLKMGPLSQG
jgi:hypothetical protein